MTRLIVSDIGFQRRKEQLPTPGTVPPRSLYSPRAGGSSFTDPANASAGHAGSTGGSGSAPFYERHPWAVQGAGFVFCVLFWGALLYGIVTYWPF